MEQSDQLHPLGPVYHLNYWGITKNAGSIQKKLQIAPPSLPYSMNALEPVVGAQSLRDHFFRHHRVHFENYLEMIAGTPAENQTVAHVMHHAGQYPPELLFELGGWMNHQLFWNNLSPHGGSASLELEDKIVKTFGSFEKFKNEFVDCAVNAGCCGWAWLVIGPGRSVSVVATEKNQSPVMGHSSHKVAPLLVIDLWEHAYHDRYKNDKHAYLNAIWRMINWTEVSQRYERFS